MNSKIYLAKLWHKRIKPSFNSFQYNIYLFYIDLDELDDIQKKLKLFSCNKFSLFSFYESDHFKFVDFEPSKKDIIMTEKFHIARENYRNKNTKEKVIQVLKDLSLDFEPGKIFLVTTLRVVGYVFNPVSFYYVFDSSGNIRLLLSEVNNTFRDQKLFYYEIKDFSRKDFECSQAKNFYISPFTNLDNTLRWRFDIPDQTMKMQIDSINDSEVELATSITGRAIDFVDKNLLFLFFRYPFYTIMVMVRIHYQALRLWFKKVPFNKKGEADDYLLSKLK